MKNGRLTMIGVCAVLLPALPGLAGCAKVQARDQEAAEAPPAAKVVKDMDVTLFKVDEPQRFALASSVARSTRPELVVTGTVVADTGGAA